MIETKILSDAVGIQRQDVIDKSETTVLPSLNNGVITGHFKRGRMDKPFKVTASNYKALLGHDPSNPSYLAVEDAFKNGVNEVSVLRVGQTGGAGAGGGDGGDGGDGANSYITLATPSTSLMTLEGNQNVAACLKIQIGDNAPAIRSFITDNTMGTHRRVFTDLGVTPDLVALDLLLEFLSVGQPVWGYLERQLTSEVTFYASAVVPDIGEAVPSSYTFAGLDDILLKYILKEYVADYGHSTTHLVDASTEEIQSWINASLPSYITSATISDTPTTITISRCTASEIGSLFEGDHAPHVDMFDAVKFLLVYQNSNLNDRGFKPAVYNAVTDSIEFISKYSVTVKLPYETQYP